MTKKNTLDEYRQILIEAGNDPEFVKRYIEGLSQSSLYDDDYENEQPNDDNIGFFNIGYRFGQHKLKQQIAQAIEDAKPDPPKALSWRQGIQKKAFEDAIRVYEYRLKEELGLTNNKEK